MPTLKVLGQVLRRGMALAAVGVALGLAGAVAATRLIRSLLAGVSPHDPWIFVAVSILLTLAALGANLVPARRAANVDPVDALRFEQGDPQLQAADNAAWHGRLAPHHIASRAF